MKDKILISNNIKTSLKINGMFLELFIDLHEINKDLDSSEILCLKDVLITIKSLNKEINKIKK